MLDYVKIYDLVEKLDFDPKRVTFEKFTKKPKVEKPKYDYYKYHKKGLWHPDHRKKLGD